MKKIVFSIIAEGQTTSHTISEEHSLLLKLVDSGNKLKLPECYPEHQRRGWETGMEDWNVAHLWFLQIHTGFERRSNPPFNTKHYKSGEHLGHFLYSIFMLWKDCLDTLDKLKVPLDENFVLHEEFGKTCADMKNVQLRNIAFGIQDNSMALYGCVSSKQEHYQLVKEEIQKLKEQQNPYDPEKVPNLHKLIKLSLFLIKKTPSDSQAQRKIRNDLTYGAWKDFLDTYSKLNTYMLRSPAAQIVKHYPDGKIERTQPRKKGQAKSKVIYSKTK
jgi:hypothetical protein